MGSGLREDQRGPPWARESTIFTTVNYAPLYCIPPSPSVPPSSLICESSFFIIEKILMLLSWGTLSKLCKVLMHLSLVLTIAS